MPPPRSYAQPAAPAYSNYYQPARPAAQPVAAAAPPPASALIRPVRFNHNKPLVAQYGTYVMYDVAEVMANRAADLIRSCREEYARELMENDE